MKTGAKVLYIIGAIFAFIGVILCLVFAAIMTRAVNDQQFLNQIYQEMQAQGATITLEEIKSLLSVIPPIFYVWAVFLAANGVVSIVGTVQVSKNNPSIAIHIAAIVLGVLAANIFLIIAGILAIVGKEETLPA